MTYQISKEFAFSASHQLAGLPEEHQCARLHGHNYLVVLRLTAESLTGPGFVFDYGDMAPFKDWLDDTFDHRHLNDVVDFNPTAEQLAAHLADCARDLLDLPPAVHTAVGVSETPKTWAWYTP